MWFSDRGVGNRQRQTLNGRTSTPDLKRHEDDLFRITTLERGEPLPVLGSTLLDGDTVAPESIIAHGAIRQADTALDSQPIDHLLSRLVIPIDDLANTLNEQYLWAPDNEGDPPREEPRP